MASERARKALAMRRQGLTYLKIAVALGVSAVRARQLVGSGLFEELGSWTKVQAAQRQLTKCSP